MSEGNVGAGEESASERRSSTAFTTFGIAALLLAQRPDQRGHLHGRIVEGGGQRPERLGVDERLVALDVDHHRRRLAGSRAATSATRSVPDGWCARGPLDGAAGLGHRGGDALVVGGHAHLGERARAAAGVEDVDHQRPTGERASGLPGKRVEPQRAGMMATGFTRALA